MGKSNRICYLCGRKYSYCPTCGEDLHKPSWYSMWCSENCKSIDSILASHTVGKITSKQAKEKITELNLSNLLFKNEDNQKHYSEIMNSSLSEPESNDKISLSQIETSSNNVVKPRPIITKEVKIQKKKK